jgi:hypothetical protein
MFVHRAEFCREMDADARGITSSFYWRGLFVMADGLWLMAYGLGPMGINND